MDTHPSLESAARAYCAANDIESRRGGLYRPDGTRLARGYVALGNLLREQGHLVAEGRGWQLQAVPTPPLSPLARELLPGTLHRVAILLQAVLTHDLPAPLRTQLHLAVEDVGAMEQMLHGPRGDA